MQVAERTQTHIPLHYFDDVTHTTEESELTRAHATKGCIETAAEK
jgi:hypothetical protein